MTCTVFSDATFCASHEFARLTAVPVAHEVGIRMNGPLLAMPLKVRAIFVIWMGIPFDSRGWSAKVDSSPYPSGPGRTKTGDCRKIFESPPSASTTIPTRAGSSPVGARLYTVPGFVRSMGTIRM